MSQAVIIACGHKHLECALLIYLLMLSIYLVTSSTGKEVIKYALQWRALRILQNDRQHIFAVVESLQDAARLKSWQQKIGIADKLKHGN